MTGSLAIAAPPLLAVLLLLWSLDRQAGRSGTVLLLSLLWGGLVATSLVLLVNATWLEQPGWYPYVVTPLVEELAKAALFAVLVPLLLVPGVSAGLAYGLLGQRCHRDLGVIEPLEIVVLGIGKDLESPITEASL